MTTEDERPATESDDMLARAAAQGPIAGIPRDDADEPAEAESTELPPEAEGDDFTGFNLRG